MEPNPKDVNVEAGLQVFRENGCDSIISLGGGSSHDCAMAHQLGGMYNLPHGVCNAILLPHVEEFNLIGNANRFRDIAKAMGEITENLSTMDAARKAIAAIRQLSSQVGIPERLRDLGVKEEDFPVMAENAMKDVCSVTNPRKATKEQIIGIFKAAY